MALLQIEIDDKLNHLLTKRVFSLSSMVWLFATVPYKGWVNKLKPDQADTLRQAWAEGKYSSKAALGKAFGISRQAVYRYLNIE